MNAELIVCSRKAFAHHVVMFVSNSCDTKSPIQEHVNFDVTRYK